MSRPLWFVDLIKKAYPGRDLLARFAGLPGVNKFIEIALFEGDALWYLPADENIKVQERIEPGVEHVLPSQVAEYFIQNASLHWIMDRCICRDSSKCQDYPIDLGCLFMGPAAMKINPGLGRPVSREEALNHIRACREAGLIHLIGRNKLDTQWLGAGPGSQLLTVCNCCPCCCLWRMLPHLPSNIRDSVQPMPGLKIEVSEDCTGCEACSQDVCFVHAIEIINGRAIVNGNCVVCGRCVDACPVGAIDLRIVDHQYAHSTIKKLSALVELD